MSPIGDDAVLSFWVSQRDQRRLEREAQWDYKTITLRRDGQRSESADVPASLIADEDLRAPSETTHNVRRDNMSAPVRNSIS